MTQRHRHALTGIMRGLSVIAPTGLLMLLARGYYILVFISIGVMFGICAFTFFYNRRETLVLFLLLAGVGYLALGMRGYYALALAIMGITFSIGALIFLYYEAPYVWSWWFPDQLFGPTVKRWLRYIVQAAVVGMAYVHMRAYINYLTGVDPGNFPTALAALTALDAIVWWLYILGLIMLVTAAAYAGRAFMASWRGKIGPAEIGGVSATRWGLRIAGAGSLFVLSMLAIGLSPGMPWLQRAARILVTNVLVFTEYSYDQTCSMSSERRLVAHLKDRKEMKASIISIAEDYGMAWPGLWWIPPLLFFREYTFSRGTCVDQSQP
jgi:hypothetical protein